jgi:hypothetical protein
LIKVGKPVIAVDHGLGTAPKWPCNLRSKPLQRSLCFVGHVNPYVSRRQQCAMYRAIVGAMKNFGTATAEIILDKIACATACDCFGRSGLGHWLLRHGFTHAIIRHQLK